MRIEVLSDEHEVARQAAALIAAEARGGCSTAPLCNRGQRRPNAVANVAQLGK